MAYNDDLPRQARQCRDAADLIRHAGHCKGALSTPDGRHCIVGALMAVDMGGLAPRMISTLEQIISEQYAEANPVGSLLDGFAVASASYIAGVVDWNNSPPVTGDDVIALLEKAAARLEERV